MNSIMTHTALEENSFYRHKKFDQAKHKGTDSCSSTSSSDGDDLGNGLEIERKIHPFLKQIGNVTLSHFNWPVLETKSKRNHAADSNIEQQLPAAKRLCNVSVARPADHCEPAAKSPQSLAVSTSTQLQQSDILPALVKRLKRKLTPKGNTNQQLPLAKRPCGTASIAASNTNQYATAAANSDQHLPPVQRSYNSNVISNSNQHVPLAQRNCTSTITSNSEQYMAPAPGTNTSDVSARMPALDKETQRNLPAVVNADQNMPPPTRPRSFSASTSRSAYPLLRLNQLPLANTPYTSNVISNSNQHVPLTQGNRTSTVTSNSDQYVSPVQGTYVSTRMPALEKEAQGNPPADQNMPPPTRPRSFSASTSRSAYPLLRLNQRPLNNTPYTSKVISNSNQHVPLTQGNCTSTVTSNSDQYMAPVQGTYVSTKMPALEQEAQGNPLADQNMPPPTRPRSFSASTSRSAYPLLRLNQLPLNNTPYTANVISNSNQHVPLTQGNRTSTVTSNCKQYVAPVQGTNTSYVSTRMPALEQEAQGNPLADQNMPPPTRPRSFSASTSRSAYPLLRLNQLPVNNTPLDLIKPTKTDAAPASSTNQYAANKPATKGPSLTSASYPHKTAVPASPSASSSANVLPDLAKAPKTNFLAALNPDQDITPVSRQRSFSAGTGSLAYSMLKQRTQLNRGPKPASNTAQLQSAAQTLPLNFSADTRNRSSSFGVANTLASSSNKDSKRNLTTALKTDPNLAPATRPRSSSASTSSSTSSLASLKQLCRTNKSIAPPVIPPTSAILPKISHETLRNICKYHGNMVRKFPKKERTPKDQERRDKNTIACRMSRRVKKLEHIAIEEQYKEFSQKTFEIIEKSMRATAYLHELMKLCKSPEGETESPAAELIKSERLPVTAQEKKPFTIEFLAGKEEK